MNSLKLRWTAPPLFVLLLAACPNRPVPSPDVSLPHVPKVAAVNDDHADLDNDGFGGAGAWMPSCELYAQGKRSEALARLRAEHPGNAVLANDSDDRWGFVCRSLNRLQEECHRFEIEGADGFLPPGMTDPKDRAQIERYYVGQCRLMPKR